MFADHKVKLPRHVRTLLKRTNAWSSSSTPDVLNPPTNVGPRGEARLCSCFISNHLDVASGKTRVNVRTVAAKAKAEGDGERQNP